MIEKQPLPSQCIIDCLKADYGIDIAQLTPLSLGADLNASVYKAQALDRTSYFVKLKRGHHHDISLTILALLQTSGIQHIIPPVKITSGKTSQHEVMMKSKMIKDLDDEKFRRLTGVK